MKITLEPKGFAFEAGTDVTVLTAARAGGIVLPSSCRNGTCRTCLCRMVSGQVSYAIAWPGLSADEKDDGYILPCVAHAESNLVLQIPLAVRMDPALHND